MITKFEICTSYCFFFTIVIIVAGKEIKLKRLIKLSIICFTKKNIVKSCKKY